MTKMRLDALMAAAVLRKDDQGFNYGAMNGYETGWQTGDPPLPVQDEEALIQVVHQEDPWHIEVCDTLPVLVDIDSWGLAPNEPLKVYALFSDEGPVRVSLALLLKDQPGEHEPCSEPYRLIGQSDHVLWREAVQQASRSKDLLLEFAKRHQLNPTHLLPAIWAARQLLPQEGT